MKLRQKLASFLSASQESNLQKPLFIQFIYLVSSILSTLLLSSALFLSDLAHVWYQTLPHPDVEQVNAFSAYWMCLLFWSRVLKFWSELPFYHHSTWMMITYKVLWISLTCLLAISFVRVTVWWISWLL